MQFSESRNFTRWFIILASFLIVILIVWNTYFLFQTSKAEERNKMQIWADAMEALNKADSDTDIGLLGKIINNNKTIPIIVTTSRDSILRFTNISDVDESKANDTVKLRNYLEDFKKQNSRIRMNIAGNDFQYIYYGNSSLLTQLKYFPIALIFIIVLFCTLVFIFYRTSKTAAQSKLWAGMAKETAHQIGTPLSSLLGWVEIMRADNVDETTVEEIEKDVKRLQTIAERFSKVGSEPVLQELDIVEETAKSFEYLRSRTSNQVSFLFEAPKHPVKVMINPELHSWTVENLVKNAIDAMKGKGTLKVIIEDAEKIVKLKVCDSGKGMPKKQFKKVFEPGFTTKKRGWGLGLSLTRRIVEEYHKGRIKVLTSEVDKGTVMQASYRKV